MPPAPLDAHRHIGELPAFPFYGGPPIRADVTAKATVRDFLQTLDDEGTERTLVLPNYGVPVPDAAFDLVVCAMAYHWFPRKWAAAEAIAAKTQPGGVVAILCSGRGGEQAYRDILANMEPPNYVWLGAFDAVQRDIPEMEDYLVQAGLEVEDIWMERRVRHVPVEQYMERMRVVAGHIIGDPSDPEVAGWLDRVEQKMRERSGPRGWSYDFVKLYAVARKPG